MKDKKQNTNNDSYISKFINWSNKQNIFIVIGVIVFLVYFVIPVGAQSLKTIYSKSVGAQNKEESIRNYSQTVYPTVDPDPIIDCVFPKSCGGSIKLKKSECDAKICCEIGDGSFEILSPLSCSQKQKDNQMKELKKSIEKNNESIKNIYAPTYTPYPTHTPYPTTTPYPKYTSSPKPTTQATTSDPIKYQECMEDVNTKVEEWTEKGLLWMIDTYKNRLESDCAVRYQNL